MGPSISTSDYAISKGRVFMSIVEPLVSESSRGRPARLLTLPGPTRILEIELSQPLPVLSAFSQEMQYERVLCLIRFHTQPLGILQFQFYRDIIVPEEYAPVIWQMFQHRLLRHLEEDKLLPVSKIPLEGLPDREMPRCIARRERFLADAPFISVIVPTRDRPDSLARCIDALAKLHYPHYEIIIVDNAPTTEQTAQLVQAIGEHIPHLRYLREDRPGISYARNCGMHAAHGEILAFTDDDVIVDTCWLAQIAIAFQKSCNIVCVTGYTLPLELETPAQLWFEGMSNAAYGPGIDRFVSRLFDQRTRHQYLYKGNVCGHGANMAVRAHFLRCLGGFDIALGAGSPAMAGEDLAFFLHILMQNKLIAYEPAALIHHHHRRTYDALRRQVFAYGAGFVAYLLHMLLRYPVLWIDLITKTPYALLRIFVAQKFQKQAAARPSNAAPMLTGASSDYPGELVRIKIKGALYGLIAYVKSRYYTHSIVKNQKKQ